MSKRICYNCGSKGNDDIMTNYFKFYLCYVCNAPRIIAESFKKYYAENRDTETKEHKKEDYIELPDSESINSMNKAWLKEAEKNIETFIDQNQYFLSVNHEILDKFKRYLNIDYDEDSVNDEEDKLKYLLECFMEILIEIRDGGLVSIGSLSSHYRVLLEVEKIDVMYNDLREYINGKN